MRGQGLGHFVPGRVRQTPGRYQTGSGGNQQIFGIRSIFREERSPDKGKERKAGFDTTLFDNASEGGAFFIQVLHAKTWQHADEVIDGPGEDVVFAAVFAEPVSDPLKGGASGGGGAKTSRTIEAFDRTLQDCESIPTSSRPGEFSVEALEERSDVGESGKRVGFGDLLGTAIADGVVDTGEQLGGDEV